MARPINSRPVRNLFVFGSCVQDTYLTCAIVTSVEKQRNLQRVIPLLRVPRRVWPLSLSKGGYAMDSPALCILGGSMMLFR